MGQLTGAVDPIKTFDFPRDPVPTWRLLEIRACRRAGMRPFPAEVWTDLSPAQRAELVMVEIVEERFEAANPLLKLFR